MAKKIKEEEVKEVKKTKKTEPKKVKKVEVKKEPKKAPKKVAKKVKKEETVVEALEKNTEAVKVLTEVTEENTKVNKKNIFITVGVVIGFVALFAALFILSNNRPVKESMVKQITGEEYLAMINDEIEEARVVVVGRASCSHCLAYKPVYTNVANEKEVTIYYLDTDTIMDEDTWNAVWEFTGTEGTPTTVVIKNHENVDAIEGELTAEEVVDLLVQYELLEAE